MDQLSNQGQHIFTLICRVAKRVVANGNVNPATLTPEDLDLDTPLWINYAYREAGPVPGRLEAHSPATRFITDARINPLLDNQAPVRPRGGGAYFP